MSAVKSHVVSPMIHLRTRLETESSWYPCFWRICTNWNPATSSQWEVGVFTMGGRKRFFFFALCRVMFCWGNPLACSSVISTQGHTAAPSVFLASLGAPAVSRSFTVLPCGLRAQPTMLCYGAAGRGLIQLSHSSGAEYQRARPAVSTKPITHRSWAGASTKYCLLVLSRQATGAAI